MVVALPHKRLDAGIAPTVPFLISSEVIALLTRYDDYQISLLSSWKMHKNTRRFYILPQAFWQAENGNQLVLTTAKNAAKKPKTYSEPGAAGALRQITWASTRGNCAPAERIASYRFLK